MAYLIRKRSYVTFPLDTVYAGQEPSDNFLSIFEFCVQTGATYQANQYSVIHSA